ncbi:hypothetical protein KJ765_06165 [Candidatus Micrarchaeota archaeon]|nr:hypothetical protein [Candidatus Micrarchaeota archaeon]
MAGLKLESADWLLGITLIVIVWLYAAYQTPFLGLLGLLALLALLARDIFSTKTKKTEERVSIVGLRLSTKSFLGISALLSAVVAALTSDLIQLFALLLLVLNALAFLDQYVHFMKPAKAAIIELDSAFFAALFVWLFIGFILNTSTPIDVVTSCSMVPTLDRGDLIIIQGAEVYAPDVTLSRPISLGADFIKDTCIIRDKYSEAEVQTLCSQGLLVDGTLHPFTKEGDIIVFEPPQYAQLGLIVHRVALKLNSEGKTYYLTKGDNNPSTDLEALARTLPEDHHVNGRMIARIPYIGYLKLFLAFQFEEPAGCRRILQGN